MSGTPVWITRNVFDSSACIGASQPKWSRDELGWVHDSPLASIPARKLAVSTGVDVGPGECVTCRLHIEIIDRT